MVALFPAARWPVFMSLMAAVVVLVIIGALAGGLGLEDIGSWRWSSGRPV